MDIFRRSILERRLGEKHMSREEKHRIVKQLEKKESEYMRLQRLKIGVKDFEVLMQIGKGAFGEVRLCRERTSNHIFAMKKLNKSDMIRRGQVLGILFSSSRLISYDILQLFFILLENVMLKLLINQHSRS